MQKVYHGQRYLHFLLTPNVNKEVWYSINKLFIRQVLILNLKKHLTFIFKGSKCTFTNNCLGIDVKKRQGNLSEIVDKDESEIKQIIALIRDSAFSDEVKTFVIKCIELPLWFPIFLQKKIFPYIVFAQ